MRISFTKMQGLGNDFLVLDARQTALPAFGPAMVRALADRQQGIGFDQLIVLEPAANAACAMRIFNRNGGEVEACGNAARAVGLMLGEPASILTRGGLITTRPQGGAIAVDMGEPRFEWQAIPLAMAMDTLSMPVGWGELEHPAAVNVGNPHVVFFVPDCDAVPLAEIGPRIEHDPLFLQGVNVGIATIVDRRLIRLRVWERGAGLTRACGTGACAAAIAAMRRRLAEREVAVHLPGGPLTIAWGQDNRITMTGPAAESFRGSFNWEDYA